MAPLDAWRAHGDSVNGLLWLDARTLVTAGYDGRVALWRVRAVRGDAYPPVGDLPAREPVREARTAPVTAAAGDAAAGLLVTGHADGTVRLWRLPALAELAHWRPHRGTVKAVALDAGGGRPVPGTQASVVRIASAGAADTGARSAQSRGAAQRPQEGARDFAGGADPFADGVRIASAGADGEVHVWRPGGAPRPLARPPTDAWTLAFAPDGRALYGGGWFRLYRWDLETGALAVMPTEHRGIVKTIAFLPDGRLATISRQTDSAVLLLDPATGATLTRLQPHDLCGAWVAASPDGRFLATTSDDASVRLWDLRALRPPVTSW